MGTYFNDVIYNALPVLLLFSSNVQYNSNKVIPPMTEPFDPSSNISFNLIAPMTCHYKKKSDIAFIGTTFCFHLTWVFFYKMVLTFETDSKFTVCLRLLLCNMSSKRSVLFATRCYHLMEFNPHVLSVVVIVVCATHMLCCRLIIL